LGIKTGKLHEQAHGGKHSKGPDNKDNKYSKLCRLKGRIKGIYVALK
jgi:hypothetical protein